MKSLHLRHQQLFLAGQSFKHELYKTSLQWRKCTHIDLANQQCQLAGGFARIEDGDWVRLQHTARQTVAVFHHYSAEPEDWDSPWVHNRQHNYAASYPLECWSKGWPCRVHNFIIVCAIVKTAVPFASEVCLSACSRHWAYVLLFSMPFTRPAHDTFITLPHYKV